MSEPNIMPEFKLLNPRELIKHAVSAVQGIIAVGTSTELCLTEHHHEHPLDTPIEPITSLE